MEFNSLKLRGFGVFNEQVSLDIDALPGKIVAICGETGAGKSTLVECLIAAITRSTPTHLRLTDLATSRESFLEVTLTHRERYTVRHFVDNLTGKSEVALLDSELQTLTDHSGNPIVDSGKVTKFDAWAKQKFPRPEVLYCSSFAPQGLQGVVTMTAAERKAVVLRVKGIDHLEALAKAAGEYARTAKSSLDTILARIEDERSRGQDVSLVEKALAAARENLELAEGVLQTCERRLDAARKEADEVKVTIERNAAARRKLSDLQMAIGRNDGEVRQLTQRIFAAQRVLEDREAIETAVAKLKDLEATSLLYRSETADLDHAVNELSRERSRLNALQIDIMADWHRAKKRLDGIGAILARKASVEKATSELPVAEASLAEAKQALEVAELHFAEVSNARLSGTEDREKYLRGGVEEIAVDAHTEGVGHARRMAQGIISEHDRMLLAAASHPTQMAAATADVKSARTQFKTRESNLASLRLTASQAEEVSRVEATKDTEEAEIARLNSAIADCKKHLAEASEDLVRKQAERKESLTRHEALKQEMAPYEAKALLAGQIASAETRLSELQPQIEKLTDEGLRLASELTSLEVPVDPVLPDVNSFQSKYRAAQDEYLSAKSSLSVMEDAMKRAVESSGKLKELSSERAKAEVELSDWTRLQKDLGKSGIQAIEVDAAAPELSELTNELLAHSFGSRWTVTFETTRLGSDGKEIEDYRIMVFDNQTGRTADISTYSGGEKAILGEAVRNSLAIVAHRSSGESGGLTLVRDETTGPLDEGIAPHYIEMLRKVADMVDASKVLFIAHNSALWDLADARVAVAAGQLTIS